MRWNNRIWICYKALANGIKNKVDIFKVDPKLGTSISTL